LSRPPQKDLREREREGERGREGGRERGREREHGVEGYTSVVPDRPFWFFIAPSCLGKFCIHRCSLEQTPPSPPPSRFSTSFLKE